MRYKMPCKIDYTALSNLLRQSSMQLEHVEIIMEHQLIATIIICKQIVKN